uniref:Uncharacterized protein n=1 Tax=Setaria italica TaxID=4555 RepID=K3ZBA2_SETIT
MPRQRQIEPEIHSIPTNRVANPAAAQIELRSEEETDRVDSQGLARRPARSLACSSIRRRPSFGWANRCRSSFVSIRSLASYARPR